MQRSEPLLIWGAGGHARVVAEAVRTSGRFQIVGFVDDVNENRIGEVFAGGEILNPERVEDLRANRATKVLVAVGDCTARLAVAARLRAKGWTFATVVHPAAVVASDSRLGEGTIAVAGAIVNPNCRVGAHVILNTACTVDHDSVIEDGVHVGPGVRLGGHVHVEREAWLGIGAVVKDRVRIGRGALIGAGAVVLQDIPRGVVAYGVPARVIRKRGFS